jgi:hypothetical protein
MSLFGSSKAEMAGGCGMSAHPRQRTSRSERKDRLVALDLDDPGVLPDLLDCRALDQEPLSDRLRMPFAGRRNDPGMASVVVHATAGCLRRMAY